MDLKATCIIPAWNEASRLPGVLSAVVGHPLVAEVLVVDDGSTDDTGAVARRHGARVLSLPSNVGKSAAVAAGLCTTHSDIVLLVDADLTGLSGQHVTDLLSPLHRGLASASVSLRSNAPLPWRLIGLDYISGERAMFTAPLRAQAAAVSDLRGFGLEVHLNRLWLEKHYTIAVVPLNGVASPSKRAKRGWLRGILEDVGMLRDIFRTVGVWTALGQIRALRRARLREFQAQG